MTVNQNFKIRTGIRILLTSGMGMLAMLLIAFSISCQATLPTGEEAVPPKEEVLPPKEEAVPPKEEATPEKEKVTEEELVPPQESAPTPELEPTPTPESEPSPTTTIAEVSISGFAFVPATITIPVGTTVTWTHNDSPPHTVSSRDGLFDAGTLSPGAAFSYTFEQNGTFEYYCKIHPYMTAKIIVGEEEAVSLGEEATPKEETKPEENGGDDY